MKQLDLTVEFPILQQIIRITTNPVHDTSEQRQASEERPQKNFWAYGTLCYPVNVIR